MAFVDVIGPDEADPDSELAAFYERLGSERGNVANVLKVTRLHPALSHAHLDLYMSLMYDRDAGLDRRRREMIAVAGLGCAQTQNGVSVGGGCADTGIGVAIAGTGKASSSIGASASGTGKAVTVAGIAVSGAGPARATLAGVAVSGTGPAFADTGLAVSGTNRAQVGFFCLLLCFSAGAHVSGTCNGIGIHAVVEHQHAGERVLCLDPV